MWIYFAEDSFVDLVSQSVWKAAVMADCVRLARTFWKREHSPSVVFRACVIVLSVA